MVKKNLVLFIIPFVLFAGEIRKDYFFSTPVMQNGAVLMEGCRSARWPFEPSVAVKPAKILLPRGQEAVSFSVTYDEPVSLQGNFTVQPFIPGGRISVEPPKEYYKQRSTVYEKNEFYPSQVRSQNFYTQYKHGHAVFVGILYPVQYNPVSKEVRYYRRMSVTVQTRAVSPPAYKCTPFIKDRLQHLVDNPEAVSGLSLSSRGPDDYEYLIVTSDALKNSFSDFIEFNKRRCLRTQVQTIQFIKSNYSGVDDADKLRNYIKEQYENNNIVYVLLGGDDDNANADDIPHRGFRASFYDYGTDFYDEKDIAADMYFSCLDGTWKVSGSQYWGEFGSEDIGWEVYASRFCVDNATELNTMIQKTIKYSEQPVVNEVKNCLLAGEYMWGPPNHPAECWGGNLMDQLIGTCTAHGYTTIGIDNTWSIIKLYDKDQNWMKSTLFNTIRDNKTTWINHVGHSNNTYVLKNMINDVSNNNYTNNGTNANFFLIYTQSCYSGSFDNRSPGGSYTSDCIGEKFTSEIGNGAIAYVGCSRYSLGDDGTGSTEGTNGSNQRYHRYFHDAIFGKNIHYLEMMNAYSKEMNADLICESDIQSPPYFGQMKYAAYNLNVLGDPALSVWTDTPQQLDPDYDTLLLLPLFTMQTPPYSWVAIVDPDGNIISTQLTGSGGNCVIDDDTFADYVVNNPLDTLKVRIKAHNYLPFEGNLYIFTSDAVRVRSPDGGEFLLLGEAYEITWIDNIGENVKIELLKSGVLHKTIAASTPSSSPYSWSVDDTITEDSDYKIRITSIDDPSVTDESDGEFTITSPILTVTSPNGGEIVHVGSIVNITWDSIGSIGNVEIFYSTDDGSNWETVVSGTANDGSHPWTVPDKPSDLCKIRICKASGGTPSDESDDVFSIELVPLISLSFPVGGEVFYIDSTYTIRWSTVGTVGDVKIDYTQNNGTTWSTIVGQTENDGLFDWKVPSMSPMPCKVRVSEAADEIPADTSDNVFIEAAPSVSVSYPNGGEVLYIGMVYKIQWSTTGQVGDIKIEYSTDDGTNWKVIESGVTNSGSYNWTIPDEESAVCRIRISESTDDNPFDISDNTFEIAQPFIELSSPNGGEVLKSGFNHYISWQGEGFTGDVRIEYSIDNGVNWAVIVDSTANDGSHSWTVPNNPSVNCKVRVSEVTNSNPFDESDAAFEIEFGTAIQDQDKTPNKFNGSFNIVPNPANNGFDQKVSFILISTESMKDATVKVYDPLGSIVYESEKLLLCNANQQYTFHPWYLKNISGRPVAGGSYLAVLMAKNKDGRAVVVKRIIGIKEN